MRSSLPLRQSGFVAALALLALGLSFVVSPSQADAPKGLPGHFIPALPDHLKPIGNLGHITPLPPPRHCDPKADLSVSPRVSHRDDRFTLAVTQFGDDDLIDIELRKFTEDASGNPQTAESRPSLLVWYAFDPARLDAGRHVREFLPQDPAVPLRLTRYRALPGNPPTVVDSLPEGRYQVKATNRATGCEVTGWFQALGEPTLSLSQAYGPVGNPITDPPLGLDGRFFRPNSEVVVAVRNAAGVQTEIARERTREQGQFHVGNLFLNGAAAFGVRGRTEVIVSDAGGYRASASYLVVQPSMYISVGGELGHEPVGDHLSFLEVFGNGFAPNERQHVEVHTRGAAANATPLAAFDRRTDADGLLHAEITTRDWPSADRATAEYDVRIPALGLSAPFELRRYAATIDVSVSGIEVTQGIQDMANSVPLIAGKDTVVRVYVRADRAPAEGVEGVVCFLSATDEEGNTLTVFTGDPENPQAGSMRADERVTASVGGSLRGEIGSTFNFILPWDWYENVGRVTFTAQVYAQTNDLHPENNRRAETVFFRPTLGVNTTQIRLHTHNPPQLPGADWDDPDSPVRIDRYQQMWNGMTIYPLSRRDLRFFKTSDLLYPLTHYTVPIEGSHFGDEYDNDLRDCEVQAIIGRLNWYDTWTDDPDNLLLGPHFWVGVYHQLEQDCTPESTSAGPTTQEHWANPGWVEGVALVEYDRQAWDYFGTRAAETFAHEVGHLLGLRHIDCNDPDDPDRHWPYPRTDVLGNGTEAGAWGLRQHYENGRSQLQAIAPAQASDLMSYCYPNWISDYTYKRVHSLLNPYIEDWIAARDRGDDTPYPLYHVQRAMGFRNKSARAPQTAQGKAGVQAGDAVAVGGRQSLGPVSFNALFTDETVRSATKKSAHAAQWLIALNGTYAGKAGKLSVQRMVLQSTSANLDKWLGAAPAQSQSSLTVTVRAGARRESWPLGLDKLDRSGDRYQFFSVRKLAFQPDRLEIRDANGRVLATRKLDGAAPSATWQAFPNGRLSSKSRLSVRAEDADGDPISVSFQLSRDRGASWVPLSAPTLRDEKGLFSADLRGETLPGSDDLKIRALVTDGVHVTVLAGRNPVSTPNHNPELALVAPMADSVGRPGQAKLRALNDAGNLLLQVSAQDVEDGVVADSAIRWVSNRSGFLGEGAILHPKLANGLHTITVTARDADGGRAQLAFSIRIGNR